MKLSVAVLAAVIATAMLSTGIAAQTKRTSPHKRLRRQCETCHVPTSFRDVRFNHEDTRFSLEGQHSVVDCLLCHNVENFSRVESACASCHLDVHRGRAGETCEQCHVPGGWKIIDSEEIHAETRFSTMGRHQLLDCESCHPGMPVTDFRRTDPECIACHRADFEGVSSPDHVESGFSTECLSCHMITAWAGADYNIDHDAAFFPIFSGAHANQWNDCAICHTDPSNQAVFSCIDCHRHSPAETDPTHNGLSDYVYSSTACYDCHPTGTAADFLDHDATFFPIYSGTHVNQWNDCSICHTDPGNRTVFSCQNCHGREVVDGAHGSMPGYAYESRACYECHPSGTAENYLEHDNAFFPIYSGIHANQWRACETCHTDPANHAVFSCVDCHNHDQTTTDATHGAMPGYAYTSASCFDCHPTGTAGNYVDHDAAFFPVYSGTHAGVWSDCAACHTDPGNTAVFSCGACHSQSATEPTHNGMPGYAYSGTACYDCHPTGTAGNYIEHDAAFFPIYSGTHANMWSECAACHTDPNNRTVFSCSACHSQSAVDPTHNGMPGYAYSGTACYDCHPTGTAGNYIDHDAAYFPIYSGRHRNRWDSCETCHTNPANKSEFTCFTCHAHSQSNMTSKHRGISGFVYDSRACVDCHPDGSE